jgi:hypothetical protein
MSMKADISWASKGPLSNPNPSPVLLVADSGCKTLFVRVDSAIAVERNTATRSYYLFKVSITLCHPDMRIANTYV